MEAAAEEHVHFQRRAGQGACRTRTLNDNPKFLTQHEGKGNVEFQVEKMNLSGNPMAGAPHRRRSGTAINYELDTLCDGLKASSILPK